MILNHCIIGSDNIEQLYILPSRWLFLLTILQDQLRENDSLREEEHVQAAEDDNSISYYHNYDSESSGTSSEPASSHLRPWKSKKTF